MNKTTGWFRIAAVVILLLAASNGCERRDQTTLQPSKKEIADQEGWNSTMKVTTAGKKAATIRYAHMRKYNKRNLVFFDGGLRVDFYSHKGEHTSQVVAEKGKLFENSGKVEIFGNVVATSDTGITLHTPRLRWDSVNEKITSDTLVTITTQEGDTLYGEGFEADQFLNSWVIKKPTGIAHASVQISDLDDAANPPVGAGGRSGTKPVDSSAVQQKELSPGEQ